jgi:hypothetical protein
VRMADKLIASVSRLSRQCGVVNISELYRPTRPVTGIALLTTGAGANLHAVENYRILAWKNYCEVHVRFCTVLRFPERNAYIEAKCGAIRPSTTTYSNLRHLYCH